MRIIVGCEFSQIVTKAFREKGHEAYSCDIIPTEGNPEWHYQEDILSVVEKGYFDMGIFHPPCTAIAVSGNRYYAGSVARIQGIDFVRKIWELPIKRMCIENPVGVINTYIPEMPKPQYIQPYDFGHNASKKTGLWLRGLPKLQKTKYFPPRIVNGKKRWGNQTDSGQNKLPPSKNRARKRAITYSGIAEAMANQWG